MIEQIPGMPAGTIGFRARGKLTAADYENVIVPDIEAAFTLHRKLRILYAMAGDFDGFEPRALWDDAKLGLRHFTGFERVAVVADDASLRKTVHLLEAVIPADVREYESDDFAKAMAWICEPPIDGGR
ncbi:STAS/SEC14 domain-containing protein [Oleiagrimonas sp. C23AA]|uniref:STAS/SEC14 domain-containing protein n=1 Tax=Oleiagrimonas sp. C23AA TaxID=2719047 RepID=UPI001423CBCD|nr:STAS/SEC14 domain-containing protein [Oleiagrimonas sp. C23AA]NII10428.1 STAS/SEC14 domain-containing protein [Oleiagrimonas sp. C23AA]